MARRKSKRKQQEDFIEGLALIAIAVPFLITYYTTYSLQTSIIVAALCFGLMIGILVARRLYKEDKLKQSGIHDIDKMDGVQFEHYLKHLFKSLGYNAKVTSASGDYGADLLLSKTGKTIVVQAKRYSKNVGIKAVQEVQASKAHYKASEAWVVTNSDFTDAAYQLAKSNDVRLINRDSLVKMILQMNPKAVPNPRKVIKENVQEIKICKRCGNKLVLRKSTRGQFYGCSSFPKCMYTESVKIS